MTHYLDLAKNTIQTLTSTIKRVGLICDFEFTDMPAQVVPICPHILGSVIPDMYGGTP